MRLNVNQINCQNCFLYKAICTKNEQNDFEEKKFSERFGECSGFFTTKDPLILSLIYIK